MVTQDTIGRFLHEQCVIGAPFARMASRDIYSLYVQWSNSIGEKPESETALGRRLRQKGCTPIKPYINGKRSRAWEGVGLVTCQEGTP